MSAKMAAKAIVIKEAGHVSPAKLAKEAMWAESDPVKVLDPVRDTQVAGESRR